MMIPMINTHHYHYSDKLRQKQAMEKQLKDYNEELRNKEDDIQRIVDELAQQNKAA